MTIEVAPLHHPQCPFIQMIDTDVSFLQYYRSCPYIRHDLYLPFIPASLQTLGRVECAVASAPAPPGLRTSNPLILTLIFSVPSGRLQKIGPECFLPSSQRLFDLCPCASWFFPPRWEEKSTLSQVLGAVLPDQCLASTSCWT